MNQSFLSRVTQPAVLAYIAAATIALTILGFLAIDSYPFGYIKLSALMLGTLALLVLCLLAKDHAHPRIAMPLMAATALYGLAVFINGIGVKGAFTLAFESLDYRTVTGVILLILFGFLAAYAIKSKKLVHYITGVILVAVLLGLTWGLFAPAESAGFIPPFENGFAQQVLTALALLVSVVGAFMWSGRLRLFARIASIFFLFAGILLFSQAMWIMSTIVAAIVFGALYRHPGQRLREMELVLVVFGFSLALLFSIFYSPVTSFRSSVAAPLQTQSISVARSALFQAPLTGVGPTNFVDAYSSFLPAGTNATTSWGVRYFSGSSRFSTMATENGIVTLAAFLLLGVAGFIASMRLLFARKFSDDDGNQVAHHVILAAAWLVLFGAYLITPGSFVQDMLFWIFTAMLAMADVGGSTESLVESKIRAAFSGRIIRVTAAAFTGLLLIAAVFLVGVRATAVVAFESGRKSVIAEDIDSALESFRTAAERNPNSGRTWTARANAAVVLLVRGVSENENPEDPLSQELLDLVAEVESSADMAALVSNGAASSETFRADILEQLAILGVPGAADKALASRERAVELDPGNPAYYVSLGTLRFDAGSRFAQLALNENNANADEQQSSENPEEAGDITPSVDDSGGDDAAASTEKANALFSSAEQAFRNAIVVKQDYAPAYPGISAIAALYGDAQSALDAQAQATVLDPRNVDYKLVYGTLLMQTQQTQAAVNVVRNALAIDPSNANTQFVLAQALVANEEVPAANDVLAKLIEQTPEYPGAQELLDSLANADVSEAPEAADEL